MTTPVDIAYELIVLRGPDPLRDNEVRGGVIGYLIRDHSLARKAIYGIIFALITGIGGGVSWIYFAGQIKGQERSELRQLRRDVDECLRVTRGGNWLQPAPRDTSEP